MSTKGGFWTRRDNKYQPKAQFRFRVEIDGLELEDAPSTGGTQTVTLAGQGGTDFANDARTDTNIAWYAKSVDKPGYEIASNVPVGNYFELGRKSPRIDPIVEHPILKQNLSMTLVDPTYPNLSRKLLRWLRRTGYNDIQMAAKLPSLEIPHTPQEILLKTVGHVRIFQLSEGQSQREFGESPVKELEMWTLINAYPAKVDFGKLDYSSDNLVEITIEWAYSSFTCHYIKLPDGAGDIEQAFTYFKDHVKFGMPDVAVTEKKIDLPKQTNASQPEPTNAGTEPTQPDEEEQNVQNDFFNPPDRQTAAGTMVLPDATYHPDHWGGLKPFISD